ncbi:DUF1295 domain-containing protein [Emticicia sp. CRIBPO]|uniref:methyltransferase family protein n=1 Tax=Emticicia sp. CRIBPO TaxID=2683258 RepID=UPI00141346C1|nr:isoprenylcysteine carboxylmethyltransferase family protein [Emticicia sp. CRIBPO]NBA86575.1 DUF1295 domain-containing protein [Emticicia sp. CRIBPO]
MALIEELEDQGNLLFKLRSYLPLVFLFGGLAVFYWRIVHGDYANVGFEYWLICLAVGLAGLFVRIFTVGFTPKNTSGRNTSEGQLADELNQTGIYSVVRHPLYVGNFLMWLGVAMLSADFWFLVAFTLLYWVYYERIMFAEEAFLRRKFGNLYLDWAAKTPAFVPALKVPTKPKYPFSIKKVLKKEKNGVAALFILFYIFELVAQFAVTGTVKFETTFWFWGAAISSGIYLVLKVIKKYTRLFDEEGR